MRNNTLLWIVSILAGIGVFALLGSFGWIVVGLSALYLFSRKCNGSGPAA